MYDSIIKYEEVADKYKNELLDIYIVASLKNYHISRWEDLTILERQQLVKWVHNIWLKQEMCLDIGCICDSTMEHRKKILTGNMDKFEFLNILATRWA